MATRFIGAGCLLSRMLSYHFLKLRGGTFFLQVFGSTRQFYDYFSLSLVKVFSLGIFNTIL